MLAILSEGQTNNEMRIQLIYRRLNYEGTVVLSVSSFEDFITKTSTANYWDIFMFNDSVFFCCSMARDDRAFVLFGQVVLLSRHVGIVPRATILGANNSRLLSK